MRLWRRIAYPDSEFPKATRSVSIMNAKSGFHMGQVGITRRNGAFPFWVARKGSIIIAPRSGPHASEHIESYIALDAAPEAFGRVLQIGFYI